MVSMAALLAMAGHEVVGLVAAYVGAQKAQALIPHIKSRPAEDSCCDVKTGGNGLILVMQRCSIYLF